MAYLTLYRGDTLYWTQDAYIDNGVVYHHRGWVSARGYERRCDSPVSV